MRKFIALNAALLLLASQLSLAAAQYEDEDSGDYDDWGFGSRGEVSFGVQCKGKTHKSCAERSFHIT